MESAFAKASADKFRPRLRLLLPGYAEELRRGKRRGRPASKYDKGDSWINQELFEEIK